MSRARLLRSLAERIADYRGGEVAPIDPDHIEQWLGQFDAGVQLPVLTELDHVLSRTYIRRSDIETFFANEVITDSELVGDDACAFWSQARFFNKPIRGQSQTAMLELFGSVLQNECGLKVGECGELGGPLVYIDDAI